LLFQTSLGIDIQEDSLSMAYLKASFRGVRLTAHAVYPLEKGQSRQEKMDQIRGLTRLFLGKNRIASAGIFLGIPRYLTVLRYVELPVTVKENLRASLGYEMEKYVPFSVDKVYFDYQVIAQDKETGSIKVLLVLAKKESIEPYLALAKELGAGISGIEISSTAMANYFSYQSDTGDGNSYAIAYLNNNDLEIDFFVKYLLHYSKYVKIGDECDRLYSLILQELKTIREEVGQSRLETVLCGPGVDGELLEQLREEEGLEVRPVDLSRTGIPSSALIPAYSLALKGIHKMRTDINLLPEEFRRRPSKFAYYTMFVLSGLLILSVLTWGGSNILLQQLHLGRLNSELDRMRSELASIDKINARCKEVEVRIDYLSSLNGSRPEVLKTIQKLTESIPKTAWIRRLAFSGKGMEIEGWGDSASELIPTLESSPFFEDVAFLSSVTRDHAGKERFRIGFKLSKESYVEAKGR
jgi:Tfp pilus assembly protein PilN